MKGKEWLRKALEGNGASGFVVVIMHEAATKRHTEESSETTIGMYSTSISCLGDVSMFQMTRDIGK